MTNLYNKFKAYALAGALASFTGMASYANAAEDEMGKYLNLKPAVETQRASPVKASRKAKTSKPKTSKPAEISNSTQTPAGYHVGLSTGAFAELQKTRAERHYLDGTLLGVGYLSNDVQMPVVGIGKLWDKYGLMASFGYGQGKESPTTKITNMPADPITGFSANGSRTESKTTRAAYAGLDGIFPLKTYVRISEVQTSTDSAKPKWEVAEKRFLWFATAGLSLEQKVETTNTRTVENIVNALGQTVATKTNNYSKEDTSNNLRVNLGTGVLGKRLGARVSGSFGKDSQIYSIMGLIRFGNDRWPNPKPAKLYNSTPQKVPEKKAKPAKKVQKKAAEKKTEKKN